MAARFYAPPAARSSPPSPAPTARPRSPNSRARSGSARPARPRASARSASSRPGKRDPGRSPRLDPVDAASAPGRARRARRRSCGLEASTHGLDQFRLDGLKVAAAAFTNLTPRPSRLSRHHGRLSRREAAAVHRGDGAGRHAPCSTPTRRNSRSSPRPAARAAIASSPSAGSQRRSAAGRAAARRPRASTSISRPSASARDLFFPVAGAFQASNALAALGLAIACGEAADAALAALSRARRRAGRIEHVAQHPNGAPIYVDYAHKPDALEAVLTALRPHARGRLVVVFGCGGDRDRGKRPLMGEIADAARRSRHRHRRQSAQRGSGGDPPRDPGRLPRTRARSATARAGDPRRGRPSCGPSDLLVIAGKGHETRPDHRRRDPSLRRQRRSPRRRARSAACR